MTFITMKLSKTEINKNLKAIHNGNATGNYNVIVVKDRN